MPNHEVYMATLPDVPARAAIDPEGLVITMRSHWQSEADGGAGGGGGGGEVVEDDGQAAVAVAMAAAREVPPGDE